MHDSPYSAHFRTLRDIRSPLTHTEMLGMLAQKPRGSRITNFILYAIGCSVVAIALFSIYYRSEVIPNDGSTATMKLAQSGLADTVSGTNSTTSIERTITGVSHHALGSKNQPHSVKVAASESTMQTEQILEEQEAASDAVHQPIGEAANDDENMSLTLTPLRSLPAVSPSIHTTAPIQVLRLDQDEVLCALFSGIEIGSAGTSTLTSDYSLGEHWLIGIKAGLGSRSSFSDIANVVYHDTTVIVNGTEYRSKIGVIVPQVTTKREFTALLGPTYLLFPNGSEWNLSLSLGAGLSGSTLLGRLDAAARYNAFGSLWLSGGYGVTFKGSSPNAAGALLFGAEWMW